LTGLVDGSDYIFTTQDYNSFINNKWCPKMVHINVYNM
jgi:hypothetical protein